MTEKTKQGNSRQRAPGAGRKFKDGKNYSLRIQGYVTEKVAKKMDMARRRKAKELGIDPEKFKMGDFFAAVFGG